MKTNPSLKIGWAQCDITPDRPVLVVGQFYPRISGYAHDPLTATALVIENTMEQATLVSMDVALVQAPLMNRIRAALADLPGLDPCKISFHGTHTHNSTYIGSKGSMMDFESLLGEDVAYRIPMPDDLCTDDELEAYLVEKINALVRSAWASRAPGGVSFASDYAVVAMNRRPVFDKGNGETETQTYGACSQSSFLRLEGPSDHSAEMLYTWDLKGNLTGVAVDIPCPAQVHELHSYLSADYWTSARASIRQALGPVYVLALCGSGGDQSPVDLVRYSKTNEKELKTWQDQAGAVLRNFDMGQLCDQIGDRIAEAVNRGFRTARNQIQSEPVFRHTVKSLSLPLRLVTKARYDKALANIEALKKSLAPKQRISADQQSAIFNDLGTVVRWTLQQKNTLYSFDVHVIRLAGFALATNPFELFSEYGTRIKARCKATNTMVIQLSEDYAIYLPNQAALDSGSFSSDPAVSYCGPAEGDTLVEETIAAIDALFD